MGELVRGRRVPDDRFGLRGVPRLTVGMREVLEAVERCEGRPLSEVRFTRRGREWRVDTRMMRRVMKRLLREGLIEVMGLGPAVYRLTKPEGWAAQALG